MTEYFAAEGAPRGAWPTSRDAAFAAVASMLWHERELLERVLFKLVGEQLVLRSGTVRWLSHADDELRAALTTLRESEVLRAVEVDDLVVRLGVPGDTTLRELAALAPEPWDGLMADHHAALSALVAEITSATAENRRLLHAGAEAARHTLDSIGQAVSSPATYGADGTPAGLSLGPILLDRQA